MSADGRDRVNLGHAEVLHATEKALKVQLDDEDEPRWVPKEAIHDDSEVYKAESEPGDLIVKPWFARKEGLT